MRTCANPRSSSGSGDKSVKPRDNGEYVRYDVSKKIHPWIHSQNYSGSGRMPVKSVKLGDNEEYLWDNVSKKFHPWFHCQNDSGSGRKSVKIKQNELQYVQCPSNCRHKYVHALTLVAHLDLKASPSNSGTTESM